MTKSVKYVVFAMIVALFIAYPKCGNTFGDNNCYSYLFSLAQIVVNQTLGIVHEGGHGICKILPCPFTLSVLNGTIFQLAFPLGIYLYYRKRDKFASYVALFFLGPSLQYTSWYMHDAKLDYLVRDGEGFLPGEGYHDFGYLFVKYNILDYKDVFSMSFHVMALIVMVVSVIGLTLNLFDNNK